MIAALSSRCARAVSLMVLGCLLAGPLLAAAVPGDANGDGVVNGKDLLIVTSGFGKRTGDTGWNLQADRNADGVVDIVDLTLVTTTWAPVPPVLNLRSLVLRTGQTASYAAGDDGALQPGYVLTGSRFTDNGNGTVTDNATGLIWLKNANAFGAVTWSDAQAKCGALASGQLGLSLTDGSTAGQWRLPTRKELHSLVDYGRTSPALPTGHPFSSVQSGSYWSSTSYAGNSSNAWSVGFGYGYVNAYDMTYAGSVWPVRGGP